MTVWDNLVEAGKDFWKGTRRNVRLYGHEAGELRRKYTTGKIREFADRLGLDSTGTPTEVSGRIEEATKKGRNRTYAVAAVGLGIIGGIRYGSGNWPLIGESPEVQNVRQTVKDSGYVSQVRQATQDLERRRISEDEFYQKIDTLNHEHGINAEKLNPFDLSRGTDKVAIAVETERMLKKDYLVVEHGLRPERHRTVSGQYLDGQLAAYLVDWDNASEYQTRWAQFLEDHENGITGEQFDTFLTKLQKEGLVYKAVFLGEGGEASYSELKDGLADRAGNRLVKFNASLKGKLRPDIPNQPIFSLGVKDLDGDNAADIYITVPDGVIFVDRAVGKTSGNPQTRFQEWQEPGEWFPTDTEDGYLPRTESQAQRQTFREGAIRAREGQLGALQGQLEADSDKIRTKTREDGLGVASDFIDHLTEGVQLDAQAIDAQAAARIQRMREETRRADEAAREANGLSPAK